MNPCIRLALTALALASGPIHAETFVVTRFDDPVPVACTPASCSLREAALAANQTDPFGPPNRIELPAGNYVLVRGELPFSRPQLDVVGAGSETTEIATDVILFDFGSSGGAPRQLGLRGLRLRTSDFNVLVTRENGRLLLDDVVIPAAGGAIQINDDSSALDISHSEIADSIVSQQPSGTVAIRDSRFVNLRVAPIGDPTDGPAVTVQRSALEANLDPQNTLTGRLTLDDGATATIEDSVLADGASVTLSASAQLTLRRVLYAENALPVRGGGDVVVDIQDSEFRNNPTRAIYAEGDSDWTISGSSFIANRVDGNAGGAMVIEDTATVRIDNSTFSGNTFTVAAAGNGARGAAIGYRNGTGAQLILRHVTFVAPTFLPVGLVGSTIGGLGGGTTIDISNSIVRGTCGLGAGVLQNNAGNIESAGDTCGFDTQLNRVNVATAALALDPLGDNGGATATHLPAEDSIAIDSASTPQCLDVDQRGFLRPAGAGCDVGAVEVGAFDDGIFADGFD